MTKFDQVMMQHVRKVGNDADNHTHYLGNKIKNELIDYISTNILEQIVHSIA